MTKRQSSLEPFDALIGTWATEATHPMFDGVVRAAWPSSGSKVATSSSSEHTTTTRHSRTRSA